MEAIEIKLDTLVEKYCNEIKSIVNAITNEQIEKPDQLRDFLENECEKRWIIIYDYIHANYPLQEVKIALNGSVWIHPNNPKNFLAQCHLNKYSQKFESLCYEWFLENVKGYFPDENKQNNKLQEPS